MTVSIQTPSIKPFVGGDQACELRALMARRSTATTNTTAAERRCQSIVVAGGKGGTGRSVIALNLAIGLAERGQKVAILDACPHLGNIELLCGMNGYWNLSHVLQGCRQVNDVIRNGPSNVAVISGASSLMELSSLPDLNQNHALQQLQLFEQSLDWLIVDAGNGTADQTRQFAKAARDVLIVTTSEVTAVAEAYASLKLLSSCVSSRLGLIVNQSESTAQAQQILDHLQQAARSFLHRDVYRRGILPRDSVVPISVSQRKPFMSEAPDAAISIALRQLVERWVDKSFGHSCCNFFGHFRPQATHESGWSAA